MNLLDTYPVDTLKDLAKDFMRDTGAKSVSFSDPVFIDYVACKTDYEDEGEDACSEVAWERRNHDRAVEQDMADGSYWIERELETRDEQVVRAEALMNEARKNGVRV